MRSSQTGQAAAFEQQPTSKKCCPNLVFCPQTLVEGVLNELLNNALSQQIAADPATGAERLIAAHSREIHRVPYYQLAAQAQKCLFEQQQQSSQALQQQADAAAAASKACVAAIQERHKAEVDIGFLS